MELFERIFRKNDSVSGRPSYALALETGDDAGAIELLHAAVSQGDARAMVALGTMLLLGRGIEQDAEDGIAWIRQGAVRGDTDGMMVLAAALLRGTGCARDENQAAYWYYRAGLAGSTEAVDALALLLLRAPDLAGTHFTMAQFMVLRRATRRLRVGH